MLYRSNLRVCFWYFTNIVICAYIYVINVTIWVENRWNLTPIRCKISTIIKRFMLNTLGVIIYTCSLMYLSQIWLTVNIKWKNSIIHFTSLKHFSKAQLLQMHIVRKDNYDISSYHSYISCVLFLSIFTEGHLNFLRIK